MADSVGTVKLTVPLATDDVDQAAENTEPIEAPKDEGNKSSFKLSTTEWIVLGLAATAFAGLSAYAIFGDQSSGGPGGGHPR